MKKLGRIEEVIFYCLEKNDSIVSEEYFNKLMRMLSDIFPFVKDEKQLPTKAFVCECVVRKTDVRGMCIIYPRLDCEYHKHLH